ncbi:MAG: response regulator, partial [Comamonadaceae bacterium]
PASLVAEVEVAERNARRLVALVSNLLDFSQVESRRQPPHLAPVDLCALTTDIASHFRSAIDAAGLRLQIDCDARLPKVPVDPEMWTSVVSNLLSNALKFTFAGHITIRLNALRLHAEVVVADSGIGIPEHEIPNIFKRFHRVRGARARTAEGAGIGLSMVQDLVTRMGGQVQARSREGHGTSFVIWLPYKSLRMGVGAGPGIAPAQPLPDVAADLAQQAARWILDDQPSEVLHDLVGAPHPQARPADGAPAGLVVVVDDNADMRSYLRRLLGGEWEVDACADAATALDLIRRRPPQAVVADVTMPGMDGFELLRRIRADIALLHIPVLLVTARAGESAAIEGLQAGADDYIAKPFSPRELLARVRAAIERARGEAALRESEAKYRALFNEMDDAYAVVDVLADAQGQWNDFRFVEVNPAFVR